MLVFNKKIKKYEIIEDNAFDEYSDVREQITIAEKTDENGYTRPEQIISGKILSSNGTHIDYDNITGYYNHGFKILTYKKCRSIIKEKVLTIGFDNLTDGEKEIACKLLIPTQAQRKTVHTVEEQIKFGKIWQDKSKKYRADTINYLFSELYNRLSQIDVLSILPTIEPLKINYLEYGIESKDRDYITGIYDYFLSTEEFTGIGFNTETFTVKGFDNCSDFSDHIIKIFNGEQF